MLPFNSNSFLLLPLYLPYTMLFLFNSLLFSLDSYLFFFRYNSLFLDYPRIMFLLHSELCFHLLPQPFFHFLQSLLILHFFNPHIFLNFFQFFFPIKLILFNLPLKPFFLLFFLLNSVLFQPFIFGLQFCKVPPLNFNRRLLIT